MQIKIEQFRLWRGVDVAAKEDDIFKTALLISDYSSHADGLNSVKTHYSNPQSKAYKDLSQFKKRSSGIILFVKLVLDEALIQLPVSDDVVEPRRMIAQLNETITAVYVNPAKNSRVNIQRFLTQINEIITHDQPILIMKEPTIALMTSLHTLLQLANTYINNLPFYKRSAARGYGVNLNKLEVALAKLLTATERKLQHCELIIDTAQQTTATQEVQNMLHAQYETILNQSTVAELKIDSLGYALNTNIDLLEQLRSLKQRSARCDFELWSLYNLLEVFVKNDEQVSDRKYCVELIAEYQTTFNLFLSHVNPYQRNELDELLNQLHSPELSQKLGASILYAISWLTALPTAVYRLMTPLNVQKMIDSALPATADSIAKQYICDNLNAIVINLNAQLSDLHQQESALITRLSQDNRELGMRLERASCEVVQQVIATSSAVAGAVEAYAACVKELQLSVNNIRIMQQADTDLAAFITINNTFFNKLMTFLAKICSLFKTDAVLVIEQASQMREQLLQQKTLYKQCISVALNNINNNPEIDSEMKTRLAEEFCVDSNTLVEPRIVEPLKPQQVKLMINNLSSLFDRAALEDPTLKVDEIVLLPESGNGHTKAP